MAVLVFLIFMRMILIEIGGDVAVKKQALFQKASIFSKSDTEYKNGVSSSSSLARALARGSSEGGRERGQKRLSPGI